MMNKPTWGFTGHCDVLILEGILGNAVRLDLFCEGKLLDGVGECYGLISG